MQQYYAAVIALSSCVSASQRFSNGVGEPCTAALAKEYNSCYHLIKAYFVPWAVTWLACFPMCMPRWCFAFLAESICPSLLLSQGSLPQQWGGVKCASMCIMHIMLCSLFKTCCSSMHAVWQDEANSSGQLAQSQTVRCDLPPILCVTSADARSGLVCEFSRLAVLPAEHTVLFLGL